ncbi:MAG: copper chaperone PCu(A)C [Geminicoccaceae bacterium]|nr:copper chaperone PCu(A)C [Geminicoccaceae bacterium]
MLQAFFARPRRFVLALVLGAAALPIAAATAAEPVKKGAIEIAEPWARATAPSQGNGAAYMVIRNHGPADRVVRAEAAVSRKVELHTHEIDAQGVARMIEIPAIELPAHATTELKPGGLHVMLIGLHRPLEAGSRFPLKLVFEKAGEVELEVEVRRAGAPMPHGAGHGMPHGAAAKSH